MRFELGEVYHIYNRGINNMNIFQCHDDYLHFLYKIRKELTGVCDILNWCLMPNHFHLIVLPNNQGCLEPHHLGLKDIQILTRKIGSLLSSYARYYNRKYKRTGSLFQQKTKVRSLSSSIIELPTHSPHMSSAEYINHCFHYIHFNPVRSGLVENAADWPYSSYNDYIGNRNGTLCNKLKAAEIFSTTQALLELECQQIPPVLTPLSII